MTPEICFSLVLHAHLPLAEVGSGGLPLQWHLQAFVEVHARLLAWIERLTPSEGGPALAVSLSPPLLSTWEQDAWPMAVQGYLDAQAGAIATLRSVEQVPRAPLDDLSEQLQSARGCYEHHGADLVEAWRCLAEQGHVELWATAATHGILPVLQAFRGAVPAQIQAGLRIFGRRFGRPPAGFWLPECAWSPDLAPTLEHTGIRLTLLDARARAGLREAPGIDLPWYLGHDVTAVVRDADLASAVWSAETGFPGTPSYREFYHGTDNAPTDWFAPNAASENANLKLWRVTGAFPKAWYDPAAARAQVERDADAFVEMLLSRAAPTKRATPPLITVAFDAELFGHWWHEGPVWLEAIFQRIRAMNGRILPIAPAAYLKHYGGDHAAFAMPSPCSWGRGGDFRQWVNPRTHWLFASLARQANRDLMRRAAQLDSLLPSQDLLSEAARHLLLAQASDWTFLLTENISAKLAEAQLRKHLASAVSTA